MQVLFLSFYCDVLLLIFFFSLFSSLSLLLPSLSSLSLSLSPFMRNAKVVHRNLPKKKKRGRKKNEKRAPVIRFVSSLCECDTRYRSILDLSKPRRHTVFVKITKTAHVQCTTENRNNPYIYKLYVGAMVSLHGDHITSDHITSDHINVTSHHIHISKMVNI